MYGLTKEEIDYLINDIPDLKKYFKEEKKEFIEDLESEIDCFLTDDECMWYDEDGENWYTKKGYYIQSLYDKIYDWAYHKYQ